MPVLGRLPEGSNFLGLLNKRYDRDDYETTEDYENFHEFSFDPLVTSGDTDELRYKYLLKSLQELNHNFTGKTVNISKLPSFNESIDLLDPKTREEYSGYYKWRKAVKYMAEQSDYFKYDIPERNQKQFIDDYTREIYGLHRTAMSMLPAEGTPEREQVGNAFDYVLNKNWERIAPVIAESADEFALGWHGDTGEYMKRGIQDVKSSYGLFKQQAHETLGKAKLIGGLVAPFMPPPMSPVKSVMQMYKNINLIGEKGFEEAAKELGEGIFESGRKIEMDADSMKAVLEGPSGKYLESVGDISFDFEGALNPYYVMMKVGGHLPQQLMTTGTSIIGGSLAAGAVATPAGAGAALTAYMVGQLPGLAINYGLEAGDMYGSSRDYLKKIRDEAADKKSTMSDADFIRVSKPSSYFSPPR